MDNDKKPRHFQLYFNFYCEGNFKNFLFLFNIISNRLDSHKTHYKRIRWSHTGDGRGFNGL